MLEKTIHLFIKALIIGVLVNIGLQHATAEPLPTQQNISTQRQILDQELPTNSPFHTSNPADD
jgi:hypothetical protein